MYKVSNRTYQPLVLEDGTRILARKSVNVEIITDQLKNLEKRNLILIKKL